MGKSPGKWIKTVLLGKKSSKSSFSNNSIVEKSRPIAGKEASGDLAVDCPTLSDLLPQTTDVRGENSEFQSGTNSSLPCDRKATIGLISANNVEITRQEQAAIKAQAAFRGFLARRAFLALKGIIRLQALVRGHLVRRQAIATLRCMRAIVKFQTLARGQKDAKRVDLFGVRSEKLLPNAFVSKLLASLPTALPLSHQYELVELNSAWNWLERWSSSRFWESLAQPKNVCDSKPQIKQAAMQTLDTESRRPEKGTRKASVINGDNEHEKPKRNLRKALTHQAELVLVQEQPQSELERVKRSLRKISLSVGQPSEESEAVTEKSQCSLKKVNSSEKLRDPNIAVSIEPVVETPPNVEKYPLENEGKDEEIPVINEELRSEEDHQTSNENERTRRRRSFTAKQEYPENVSKNTPNFPSYMAATESAKAKLRAQGSPRFGHDGAENGVIRRLSLQSSMNGKSSSQSPRMPRPVQANGKGGSTRSDRSLFSSRDEKVLQAGWRR